MKIRGLLVVVIEYQTQGLGAHPAAVRALDRLDIRHVDIFPARSPDLRLAAATLVVPAVADLIAIHEDLAFGCAYGFNGAFVLSPIGARLSHPPKSFVALTMVIGADMKALVVRFLHCTYRPGATDDRMGFEQFHRTVGTHLRGDDGAEIILEINRVDRYFRTIGVGLNLQGSLKLLVFVPIPMKADTDAHVLQNERVLPLLELDMRCRQYAYANLHYFIRAASSHVRKRSLYQLLRFMATMSQLASELSSHLRQL